jgi:hypothetical protein
LLSKISENGALGEAKHKLFEVTDLIKNLEDWEQYLRSEPEVARWLRSHDDEHEPHVPPKAKRRSSPHVRGPKP